MSYKLLLPKLHNDSGTRVVLGLTTGILLLAGLSTTYQSVLRRILQNTFSLSPIEWIFYTTGPFIFEPILLFAALYYAGSRFDVKTSLSLLSALGVAVVAGSLLGFFLSGQIWGVAVYPGDGASVRVAWSSLLALDPLTIGYWRLLVQPLVRDFLTVIAALGLAKITN